MNAEELAHALGENSRFEVLRVLGEGGMGTAYEALDRERSAPVALKTLRDVDPDAHRPPARASDSFSTHLRARTALAAAAGSQSPRALLREVDRAADRLESERMLRADPLAALVRPDAANLRGDHARAAAHLDVAIGGRHAASLGRFEAAARLRRGRLLGGDAGLAEAALADRWMRERGVVSPERTAAMMAPGFRG